ncbi:hypothetical protein [Thalassobacillus sp. C254]|uniref:hypothetical protein n=1 Tax=Thalassobacillus sp. C254 TaxID=1225341 RepID=UPI0006CF7283|nr:hypothetical protein [Thalassobacillus sp. C254]
MYQDVHGLIVHLPSWEEGNYGYTFVAMTVFYFIAWITLVLLRRAHKEQLKKEAKLQNNN